MRDHGGSATFSEQVARFESYRKIDEWDCWITPRDVEDRRWRAWRLYGLGPEPRYIGTRCGQAMCISPHHLEGADRLCRMNKHPMTPFNTRAKGRLACRECYEEPRKCDKCGRWKTGDNAKTRASDGAVYCRWCHDRVKIGCTQHFIHDIETGTILVKKRRQCLKCWRKRKCERGLHVMSEDNIKIEQWVTRSGNRAYRERCLPCQRDIIAARPRQDPELVKANIAEAKRRWNEAKRNIGPDQRRLENLQRRRVQQRKVAAMTPQERSDHLRLVQRQNLTGEYARRFRRAAATADVSNPPVADGSGLLLFAEDRRVLPEHRTRLDEEAAIDLLKRSGVDTSDLAVTFRVVRYGHGAAAVSLGVVSEREFVVNLRADVLDGNEQVAFAAVGIAWVQREGVAAWREEVASDNRTLGLELLEAMREVASEPVPAPISRFTNLSAIA